VPRFVQVQNQAGEWELMEVEDRPRGVARLQLMTKGHRPSAYRSPIDGSIISSERSERYHKEKHGVIHMHELGGNEGRDYMQGLEEGRQRRLRGEDPKINRKRKEDIVQTVQALYEGAPAAKLRREGDVDHER